MMVSTIRTQKFCYLSTPKHLKSFIGKFIYFYTGHGSLQLSADSLIFTGKKQVIAIPLRSIQNIRRGQYCRLAKIIPLHHIAITYSDQTEQKTILLTPTNSWITPVWQANKITAEWLSLLKAKIHESP